MALERYLYCANEEVLNTHNAGRADEDEVFHVLRVLERVGSRQVAAHGVADQHHLVNAHALPPRRQRAEEELLCLSAVARRPRRPACGGQLCLSRAARRCALLPRANPLTQSRCSATQTPTHGATITLRPQRHVGRMCVCLQVQEGHEEKIHAVC